MKDLISQLQLRGDEKILDVGCRDGRITAEISKLLPQGYVIGLDIFPEVIEFTKISLIAKITRIYNFK